MSMRLTNALCDNRTTLGEQRFRTIGQTECLPPDRRARSDRRRAENGKVGLRHRREVDARRLRANIDRRARRGHRTAAPAPRSTAAPIPVPDRPGRIPFARTFCKIPPQQGRFNDRVRRLANEIELAASRRPGRFHSRTPTAPGPSTCNTPAGGCRPIVRPK